MTDRVVLAYSGGLDTSVAIGWIAAETGILGLTAFLGAVIATLIQLARARASALPSRPDLAAMAAGFMLAIVAYLASGLFLHLSYARYFWLILALAGAAA